MHIDKVRELVVANALVRWRVTMGEWMQLPYMIKEGQNMKRDEWRSIPLSTPEQGPMTRRDLVVLGTLLGVCALGVAVTALLL
jgi:hypothetical protein